MNKMPTAALCAHVHDSCSHVADQRHVDAFVSTIYEHPRTIELCKEIAQLCKCVLAEIPIPDLEFHHLPLKKSQGKVLLDDKGIPYLSTKSYELLNRVLHMPKSDDRDISLTLLTKLHCYVLPLKVETAVGRVVPMIRNIETPWEIDSNILSEFESHVESIIDSRLNASISAKDEYVHPFNRNWHKHLISLQDLAMMYYTSSKKRPCMLYQKDTDTTIYDSESEQSELNSFVLPSILTNSSIRALYLSYKHDFMTLVSGKPVLSVLKDSDLFRMPAIDAPIGRMGMRLQEAEKIRLLWMPLAAFESLTQPAVSALEFLVRTSKRQSAFLDDEESSKCIQEMYFHNGNSSQNLIYSIDQSSFTDNFPYKLQRKVLEVLYRKGIIPEITLKAFDLQVLGPYAPARFFKETRVENVRFAKGTPMGGYGTWMLSSISHEFLLDLIQTKCNHSKDGMFQGDDTVFSGDDVYRHYLNYMSAIGCSVNQQKTMVSRQAIEYCGWIITPSITCPMFRPHDRFNCHVSDVASPRAKQAFGEDKIISWVLRNRPQIFDQLRIEGYITIRDDDDDKDIIISARSIFRAIQRARESMPTELTSERANLLGLIQAYFPEVVVDELSIDKLTDRSPRSSRDEYLWKVSMLKSLYNTLLHNKHCDLNRVVDRIQVLCDDLVNNHTDHTVVLRESTPKRSEDVPFFIKKRVHLPDNSKIVKQCLDLARERLEDSSPMPSK